MTMSGTGASNDAATETSAADLAMDELRLELVKFQTRNDSLRIPASRIAAMTGFHPFTNVPELLLSLVYQGRLGRQLKRMDARALCASLVDPDTIFRELAKKASEATAKALEEALAVKDGSKRVDNVQAAHRIKSRVIQEARRTQKLTPAELQQLAEAARSSVDTGFGRYHEDEALDLYQQQCGWPVQERNTGLSIWSFQKLDQEGQCRTVVPIAEASTTLRGEWKASKQSKRDDAGKSQGAQTDSAIIEPGFDTMEIDSKPFFLICGSVDGIREEIFDSPTEEFDIRKVIVECKHRMRNFYKSPPIYDQIQAICYCQMYNATEADIIQVVRKRRTSKRKRGVERNSSVNNDSGENNGDSHNAGTNTIKNYFLPAPKEQILSGKDSKHASRPTVDSIGVVKEEEEEESQASPANDGEQKEGSTRAKDRTEVDSIVDEESKDEVSIVVSRVSLNDPIMNHRQHWESILLPRLRLFVDLVFKIREDGMERRRWLTLVELADDTEEGLRTAWTQLSGACPWLETPTI